MAPAGSQKRAEPGSSEDAPQEAIGGSDAPVEGVGDKSKDNSMSWYTPSWPRKPKAAAVTEVARESISAASTVASERLSSAASTSVLTKPLRSPSIELTKKGASSTRSLPADAATTRVNIGSVGSTSVPDVSSPYRLDKQSGENSVTKSSGNKDSGDQADESRKADSKELSEQSEVGKDVSEESFGKENHTHQRSGNQSSGWLGWLSRAKNEGEDSPSDSKTGEIHVPTESGPESTPAPELSNVEESTNTTNETSATAAATATTSPSVKKRSWLQMWSGSAGPSQDNNGTGQEPYRNDELESTAKQQAKSSDDQSTLQANSVQPEANDSAEIARKKPQTRAQSSSSWLFWSSRGPPKPLEPKLDQSEPTYTDNASGNRDVATTGVSKPKGDASDVKERSKNRPSKETPGALQGPVAEPRAAPSPPPGRTKTPSSAAARKAREISNQLLPPLSDSFAAPDRPGIIEQIGRFLQYPWEAGPKHVSLVSHPPRVKRAVAIGIHGYFPAPLLNRVIGQPTGTSVKFSTMAAQAIHEWAESHGSPCEVEKIALEGEGRIEERYELLWNLLLNWVHIIRKADFILVACHSQGVPVATMLVAKLISFGCVNSARIGICAMAGVNLGPFSDYRSRFISGSAGELFEFANPDSQVSKDHVEALEKVLNFGVRISYIGSIDDQLVSLESSVFSTVSHPHIYRAVFVDGRVHAPSFLSHLVGFVMKLRNLGLSDHGLLRELSSPLAGSLYTGEGHSQLYNDENVYRLAIQFTLETSSIHNASLEVLKYQRSPNSNPYILPFAMRGVLEEDYVRRELAKETAQLLSQFDEWKPSSKVLKDVKFRLEGIRSKL